MRNSANETAGKGFKRDAPYFCGASVIRYRERLAIRRIESFIKKVAYGSVVLDFIVAVSTFFYSRKIVLAGNFLILGDYMIMLEVFVITIAVSVIIYIKYKGYLSVRMRSILQSAEN